MGATARPRAASDDAEAGKAGPVGVADAEAVEQANAEVVAGLDHPAGELTLVAEETAVDERVTVGDDDDGGAVHNRLTEHRRADG